MDVKVEVAPRASRCLPLVAACCVHARRCFGQRASIVATEVRTVRSTACRIVSRCSTDLAWPSLGVQRLVHATSELAAKPYPLDCQVADVCTGGHLARTAPSLGFGTPRCRELRE